MHQARKLLAPSLGRGPRFPHVVMSYSFRIWSTYERLRLNLAESCFRVLFTFWPRCSLHQARKLLAPSLSLRPLVVMSYSFRILLIRCWLRLNLTESCSWVLFTFWPRCSLHQARKLLASSLSLRPPVVMSYSFRIWLTRDRLRLNLTESCSWVSFTSWPRCSLHQARKLLAPSLSLRPPVVMPYSFRTVSYTHLTLPTKRIV